MVGGGRRRVVRHRATAAAVVSPFDYIQGACQLHLRARVSRHDSSSADAIARFLASSVSSSSSSSSSSGGVGNDGDGNVSGGSSPRLFLWVPRIKSSPSSVAAAAAELDLDDDEFSEWDEALASTDSFDGRNLGALAFINNSSVATTTTTRTTMTAVSTTTITTTATGADESALNEQGEGATVTTASAPAPAGTMPQIQCMVISPRIFLDDDEEEDDEDLSSGLMGSKMDGEEKRSGGGAGEEKSDAITNTNAGSATFLALQLYARHCFVPAVRAIEAMEDNMDDDYELEEKKEGDGTGNSEQRGRKMGSRGRGKTSHKLLEGLEEKLRELDIALGQCRRTTLGRIPHIVLKPHAVIAAAASAASESGGGKKGLDLDSVGLSSYLHDDTFLNEVQSTVNHWIVQIRKVTTLPNSTPFPSSSGDETEQDSASHADLEEVTFWLGLEEALHNIQSELDSPPVALTVSLLKAAKRFVATAALENNTGLDAAMFHVGDVANFLRSYPAPALAAAGDWDKIGAAVDAIFAHLPKVRMSKHYDLDRLARLVEASTLTLRARMEVVLRESCKRGIKHNTSFGGGGIVLGLDYDQYEKLVRRPTQDIFVSFDASYTTFSEFFLDQGRLRLRAGGETARNETPAQVLKELKLHHLVLRERLDAIYYFRTQHENLRSVVAEVLLGEDNNTLTSFIMVGGGGDDYSAWALREVDEAPVTIFASVDVLDLSPRGEALFTNALEGYDRKVDAIEEHLARLLRDKLSSCQVSDSFRARSLAASHFVMDSNLTVPR